MTSSLPIRKAYFNNRRPNLIIDRAYSSSSSISPYFTAKQLATIYGFPAPNTSLNNVVAVMSFGGGLYGSIDENGFLTNGDVQKYWAYEGISENEMPKVIVYPVDGTTNDLTDSDSTSENTLDVSVIGSCCPNPLLTIILFIIPQTYSLTQSFQTIIDGITVLGIKYIPSIISVSWGCPEIYYLTNGIDTTGDLNGVNNLLADATKNGLNICVAAGDNGSTDGNGNAQLSVDFPSSCPYVTAVGGTTLVCPNGVYDSSTTEQVWNDGIISGKFWATGGGISSFFSKPAYQQAIIAGITTHRAVPDIAFNADPDTGIVMYKNGIMQYGIGGTSMGAPLFAGYLASINAKTFVNPLLYTANNSECFHDIMSGCNYDASSTSSIKLYSSALGYDFCSGLGSIVGEALTSVISNAPKPVSLPIKVEDISITPVSVVLNLNNSIETQQFSSAILPINAENKTVLWSSNDTAIATMNSETGLVTAITAGNVIITVKTTDGSNKSASATLTINSPLPPPPSPILATGISLLPSITTLNLVNNRTFIFTPIISPANTTKKTIYWLSSNPRVINVNLYTGVVTALATGSAYVGGFMMDGSYRYSVATVTVLAKPAAPAKMMQMRML